jgi:hypothetical protein
MPNSRAAIALAAILLSACSGASQTGARRSTPPPDEPAPRDAVIDQDVAGQVGRLGDMFGGREVGDVILGGRGEALGAAPVNRHLWQASLDTLAFLPLASTDPFTGVIATDWGAAQGVAGERFKVTAYVTGTALDARSLRVAVFREVRQGDVWVPSPVAAETPRQIEDAILTRARQIRIAERQGGPAAG